MEFQPLLQHNPFISNVLTFDAGGGFAGWRELCRKLAREDYDLYIDMHNSIRSRILGYYLRKIAQLRFSKPRLKRFLLFYFYINLFPENFTVLNEYMKVLKPLSISGDSSVPEIYLNDSITRWVEELLRERGVTKPFVVMLPFAAWKNKRYPLEKYRELAQCIYDTYTIPVVWLGGKKDHYLAELSNLNGKNNISLIGETTLGESIAVLAQSTLVIGNDTGLSYAAEAVQTPLIVILGPTSRETGAGAYSEKSRSIEQQLYCRPCSQKGDRRCYRKRQYCLENSSVEEVFKTVESVLNDIVA
jgi:ADP-heptose:LPS heptosyltransferase